ncbi:hypothetical protein AGABI1DRAFT_120138 [Agaricus bisporus var. burnettii JB137-S8]|uniref:Uncharacterized protein n=1 Tax=Agaricus bisporus var. burnettii (strain JB137-S8 / ATCC MYA-4627 / FGSC 10392) TaxID=597362 RepID=K5WXB7_AGABU|nr:uncharacterized protein AGABI1DRAFT_120138 [Agaricus bisporus var. burnettii JB137-S8]EKM80106.1 hypothetical protein AGABI1DRAFT_120138 [Agaricus bisporus var. burnettii JB137-S8]
MPRRDMSYRKPAPLYVPSPQTSPAMKYIRPSFLKKAEREQAQQSQLRHPVIREKPLPRIPPTEDSTPAAMPRTTSERYMPGCVPAMRQASKSQGRSSSTGALSTLNNCSDSENTVGSCASRSSRRTPSQRKRHTYTLNQPYRPPTPPRQTESHRYSKGYATTILQKDRDRNRTWTHNSYDGSVSQDVYQWERLQVRGPRTSRAGCAVSVGTSPSYMTERSHFSFGVSEAWSGGMTVVTPESVLPTASQKEKKGMVESRIELDGYEFVQHSSVRDKMGMWMHSLRVRSKEILRGCCL